MSEPLAWPAPAVATGVGSMPGTDPREATNVVAGEFALFPHLVELPARGPGADPVGRTAAMLADVDRAFEVETIPSGWRLGHAGQSDLRRARTWLSRDFDALEEFAGTARGPVKVQLLGPWSLAAAVADPAGEALLRDLGAVADLAAGLAVAATALVERVRRAVPGARPVVQFDEPQVPAILGGRVRLSSGRLTHRSVEPLVVEQHLAAVLSAVADADAVPVVRCSAPRAPIDIFRTAGAQALGIDLTGELPADDALPRAWEAGVGLLLGCVTVRPGIDRMSDTALSAPLRRFMDESGFADVPANVAITPVTGLAGTDPDTARAVISACTRVGQIVRDEHPETADA